uniref:PRA1 family protein n=1 Tax=Phallusia mammillata TaxID=59560 RepID=A0A6F9DQY6_9ASCI|nr:prenylated Rab acceptor protein 1-like [Phallusia mammillata]
MTDTESTANDFGNISGKMIKVDPPAVRDWVNKRRQTIQPWSEFINTTKFRKPTSAANLSKRAVKNIQHYQTNYIFVFTGLIVYCIITSPLLLIAIGVFLGACYIIHVKNEQQNIKVFGHEFSHAQQYAIAAAFSFPLFFIAGAGAAVFWVLGVSLVLIAIHASLHISPEEGTAEDEQPFMETV